MIPGRLECRSPVKTVCPESETIRPGTRRALLVDADRQVAQDREPKEEGEDNRLKPPRRDVHLGKRWSSFHGSPRACALTDHHLVGSGPLRQTHPRNGSRLPSLARCLQHSQLDFA